MKNRTSHESLRVAHASRVLVSASRRNELTFDFHQQEKSAMTRRRHQHARRVCYPIGRANA